MKLQNLDRVDAIALATRWERVKMFWRHASVMTEVLTGGAVIALVLGIIALATGAGGLLTWVVLAFGWAVAAAVELSNPYQRLALLGGVVTAHTTGKDGVPTVFLSRLPQGAVHYDHRDLVSLELVISPMWSRKEPQLAIAKVGYRAPSLWHVCIVNGWYGVTDSARGFKRLDNIACVLDVLCYGTVQEWREQSRAVPVVFESS